ncbi:SAM-dependent methyltransferase [Nonlabens spongiae]|uniref:SAM-dependent methyltransferase n=2 Tax=Nonlabens spongiae TaxID=331648 RepID=A0A1W6MP24_9FLAO|nr:SAM-dependent methyltransferase [Nonlabens spongiae]
MDDPDLDPKILQLAVNDINKINKVLGGFKFTLKEVRKVAAQFPDEKLVICDAGCGDGEMLRYLNNHIKDERITFLGVDFSANSIQKARELSEGLNRVRFRESDILKDQYLKCDILISSLTLHHFSDGEIVYLLKKFKEIATKYIIINDLHRHRVAYTFFRLFSPIFIRNKISRQDGLISIASGFKQACFKKYALAAGIKNDLLKWKWSFRYLWIIPTYERQNHAGHHSLT